MRIIIKVLLVICVLVTLNACSSIAYYGQSVIGHNKIMWARKPIEKVLETAEPALKKQLLTAQEIRQFAVDALALPDNKSYSSYVDLDRDYPVWAVVAAEEFSLDAKAWCYPVIGCASYRGYFSEQAALDYAAKITEKGYETSVGGAIAYSTLGWFSDPLLPSMMRYGDADLAENIFHELAHQVLYIKDNSAFNEAFASVVGEQGALLWLDKNRSDLADDYKQRLHLYNKFVALLNDTKDRLADVYIEEIPDSGKREQKERIISQLKQDYQNLKNNEWGGQGYFDGWFEKPINNARLASVSTYRDQMPNLLALLVNCGHDFGQYFKVLKEVSERVLSDQIIENLPTQCSS